MERAMMTYGAYTVELRTDDGWGNFEAVKFPTAYDAIEHAQLCISGEGWTAARVWQEGPSLPGDRAVWDSRD
jgi:hypothetical protein